MNHCKGQYRNHSWAYGEKCIRCGIQRPPAGTPMHRPPAPTPTPYMQKKVNQVESATMEAKYQEAVAEMLRSADNAGGQVINNSEIRRILKKHNIQE